MFSLAKYERPTFEMEIKEGVIIHIFPPTKAKKDRLIAVQSLSGDELEKEAYEVLADLIADNREKYAITSDDIRIYTEDALIMFLEAFLEFVCEIYKDPN